MKTILQNIAKGSTALLLFVLVLLVPLRTTMAQLNTKEIGQKHYRGVVKILMYDPVLEKKVVEGGGEKGSGFLSRGSGFMVTEDGYIFTNRHVVGTCVTGYMVCDYVDKQGQKHQSQIVDYEPGMENDPAVTKLYYAGYTYPVVQVYHGMGEQDYKLYLAEVVGISATFDGAIIKIVSDMNGAKVTTPFVPVPLGDADKSVLGEDMCVFGYPAQYGGNIDVILRDQRTLTFGKNSGMDYVFNENYGFIKTDAEIHGGNSGGPVFGEGNKVIGIATAKGVKTSIGLVGGVNAMYHVVGALNPGLQQRLAKVGLKPPTRQGKNQTIAGNQRNPLPDVNAWAQRRSGGGNNLASNNSGGSSAAVVNGVVTSADTGKPLAGVQVGILVKKNEEWVVLSRGTSDEQGRYAMAPGIRDGKYAFAAIKEGYQDVVAEVEVIKGQREQFTVKMTLKR